MIFTVDQGKKKQNVIIMSSMLTINIFITNDAKKMPKIVSFYNKTKCGVNIVDKIRWPGRIQ